MAVFLTEKELQSKRFVGKEMFRGIKREDVYLTELDWMFATYASRDIENGVELGLCDSITLFKAISPFTKSLVVTLSSQLNDVSSIEKITFKIKIKTEGKTVKAGEFYYKTNGSLIKPKREVFKINEDLFRYLDRPFKIVVKEVVSFFPIPYQPKKDLDNSCRCKLCMW